MSETRVSPDLLRSMPLPTPEEGGGKEARGRVLLIGGSTEVAGAALLAGVAVLRAGAGKLQVATVRTAAPHLGVALPEARVVALAETPSGGIDPACAEDLAGRAGACAAVLIGPGMMDTEAAAALTAGLLARVDGPGLVIDAAAMMRLRDCRDALRRHAGRVVITPHAGEMAGLLGIDKAEVEADPAGVARHAAAHLGVVVILKGACSRIATPEGQTWCSDHGNVGLATSGSGDTLAGIIVALLARGAMPLEAALWGVYVHAEAGERLARARGPIGYLARELPDEVPGILADLARPGWNPSDRQP